MKKILSILITTIMLVAIFSVPTFALNDAEDLNYKLELTLMDEKGNEKTNFEIDEVLFLKVALKQLGTGSAPLYGVQGNLVFDTYSLQYNSSDLGKNITSEVRDNQVVFEYLFKTVGEDMQNPHYIGTFSFKVCQSDTVNFEVENFILTNRDASIRNVDSTAMVTAKLGDGKKAPTLEALISEIQKAQQNLEKAVISDEFVSLFYPNFSVTTSAANTYKEAIATAKLLSETPDLTKAQITMAISTLSNATVVFEMEKHYGFVRNSWSNSDTKKLVTVKATAEENGKILSAYLSQNVIQGTSVTIVSKPDEGYDVEYIYINAKRFDGAEVYTIPTVDTDTQVRVTFCKKPPFTDVNSENWYYASVRYVTNNGLFKGMTQTTFMPESEMNRAMMATVLYRMSGETKVDTKAKFTDVKDNEWYSDAINWAVEKGVMIGMSDKEFGPETLITREQIATIFYRYSGNDKNTNSDASKLQVFTDMSEISSWAKDAMVWAYADGLIKGISETQIAPKKTATRAELATILMRYHQK